MLDALAGAAASHAALGGLEYKEVVIPIAAAVVAFALLWYASLRLAAIGGGVGVAAKSAFLILTCLACIAIGFFLPKAPVINALIGSAFWAGVLATAGSFAGMALSDAILARLEGRSAIAGAPARDKRPPPL